MNDQDTAKLELDAAYSVEAFDDMDVEQLDQVHANVLAAYDNHAERMLAKIKDIRKLQRKHRKSAEDDAPAADKD